MKRVKKFDYYCTCALNHQTRYYAVMSDAILLSTAPGGSHARHGGVSLWPYAEAGLGLGRGGRSKPESHRVDAGTGMEERQLVEAHLFSSVSPRVPRSCKMNRLSSKVLMPNPLSHK